MESIERETQEPYELTAEHKASIERGLADARNGRFVSDQEIEALSARYREV